MLINILLGHHAIPPVVNNSSSSYLVQQVQRAHLWPLHLCLFEEAFNNIIGLFWVYITVYMLCTFTIYVMSRWTAFSCAEPFWLIFCCCVFLNGVFFFSFLLFDFTYIEVLMDDSTTYACIIVHLWWRGILLLTVQSRAQLILRKTTDRPLTYVECAKRNLQFLLEKNERKKK